MNKNLQDYYFTCWLAGEKVPKEAIPRVVRSLSINTNKYDRRKTVSKHYAKKPSF